MSERPSGGSSMARRRCWRLCGGANYAGLLDAMLTFNAAALTGRQMQPNNTAPLPLSLRSCLSVPFNLKKITSKKGVVPLHLLAVEHRREAELWEKIR